MTYTFSRQWEEIFAKQVFSLFTDAIAKGNPDHLSKVLHDRYIVDDFAYHSDMIYFGIIKYFQETVIPHKIQVYNAGFELSKQDWFSNYIGGWAKELFLENLFFHDLSKFSANEAFGYAMYNRQTGHGKQVFEEAWHHHKMNNPHHPEYWLNPNRSGELEPIPMPPVFALEMIADWIGAGKSYGSTLEQWLPGNLHKFKFGASTSLIKNLLYEIGIQTWIHEGNVLKTTQ